MAVRLFSGCQVARFDKGIDIFLSFLKDQNEHLKFVAKSWKYPSGEAVQRRLDSQLIERRRDSRALP
jgi:hypothetical protein